MNVTAGRAPALAVLLRDLVGAEAFLLLGVEILANAELGLARRLQIDLAYRIVGAQGMLMGAASPMEGDLQPVNLASPGTRLGGGSDEIQLNVLGERGLGLPREPSSDRDVPYRDLKVGTQNER